MPATAPPPGPEVHHLEVSGETGEFDPDTQFEHSAESIERLALFGCELVRMLAENDQRRAG